MLFGILLIITSIVVTFLTIGKTPVLWEGYVLITLRNNVGEVSATIIMIVLSFVVFMIGFYKVSSFYISNNKKSKKQLLREIKLDYEKGNLEECEEKVLAFLKSEPSNEHVWIFLGNIYFLMDRDEDSEKAFLKVISINPYSSKAYNGLGVLYRKLEEYDKAIEYCNKALNINPRDVLAYCNMALTELQRYKDDKALEYIKIAHKIAPDNLDVLSTLAIVYHYNNMIERRDRIMKILKEKSYPEMEYLYQIFKDKMSWR
ncbi:tetratricopeptide repeat protein [Thermohalobacter berrensis]|uniref:Uncharacterized protein n=1 Tax=Thermohalobacter berrensis TaxID=99594 RepID=A0A419SXQ2_9FIRM|nr:tetratricopeptide repeat protein [Thermohalobacter berrensis]RKD30040.1 hypothetical protein BET03_04870 [Thermohalobacter berrensis]